MATILTYTNIRVELSNPHIDDICIFDIAHALSLLCRFVGHCDFFYSVAQHSVLTSLAISECPTTENELELAKWALLHETGEAFLGDLSRPLKSLFPGIGNLEEKFLVLTAEKFGLRRTMPKEIREIDDRMLITEMKWFGKPIPKAYEHLDLLPFKPESLSPIEAEILFYSRFEELFC